MYMIHLSAEPDCRVRTLPQLPNHLIFGVEYFSYANGMKLVRLEPGKSFLLEGLGEVHSGSMNPSDLSLCGE